MFIEAKIILFRHWETLEGICDMWKYSKCDWRLIISMLLCKNPKRPECNLLTTGMVRGWNYVDEGDNRDHGCKISLCIHSLSVEVTKLSLIWGKFGDLRTVSRYVNRPKALSDKFWLIPSKPSLSKLVSNPSKTLSFSLCIRPCKEECVYLCM